MTNEQQDLKIAPGYYDAKIINYGMRKTKAGEPAPVIMFEVEIDSGKHRVFWQGSFKDGPAREISLKALATCGFSNVRGFAYLADGPSSGLLDMEKDIQITIEHETDPETGKKYPRVRWINESGGGKFKNAMSSMDAAVLMLPMGLEADFLRIAADNGFKTTTEIVKTGNGTQSLVSGDIPF